MTRTSPNVDAAEIGHFDAFGEDWWRDDGGFRTLHDINPARLDFIRSHVPVAGQRGVDIGCGGGILTEALARAGATMLGIDMSEAAIRAAKAHATLTPKLPLRYELSTAETLADEHPGSYDFVTCLEMLEHVPQPAAVVHACARLVRPRGYVFLSTINRTAKAYALAVVGAEYVLGLLPRGTHDYARFLRPSELDGAARDAGLALQELRGMHYDPLVRRAKLCNDVSVNYLAAYVAPALQEPVP
ncbi:MAG: bifunctional 2-polyprenyl-6-hydroxyphenol methylase/3-demethylubiquinol 3-O-methyltransferase UbiG [Pseudomonadota bacterium]